MHEKLDNFSKILTTLTPTLTSFHIFIFSELFIKGTPAKYMVILVAAVMTQCYIQSYIQWVLILLTSQLLTRPRGREILRTNDFLFLFLHVRNTFICPKLPILVSSPHQEVSFSIPKQYFLSVHTHIFFKGLIQSPVSKVSQ